MIKSEANRALSSREGWDGQGRSKEREPLTLNGKEDPQHYTLNYSLATLDEYWSSINSSSNHQQGASPSETLELRASFYYTFFLYSTILDFLSEIFFIHRRGKRASLGIHTFLPLLEQPFPYYPTKSVITTFIITYLYEWGCLLSVNVGEGVDFFLERESLAGYRYLAFSSYALRRGAVGFSSYALREGSQLHKQKKEEKYQSVYA